MPDGFSFSFDNEKATALIQKLASLGANVVPVLRDAVEDGAIMVANSAKEDHYFVGTAKGATARAKEHELDFKNPDGSLRFKIRTANLQNSIQPTRARVADGAVSASVKVGMKYGRAVEEGAPGRRAFPYLRPAFERNRAAIVERIVNGLRVLEKVWGTGA